MKKLKRLGCILFFTLLIILVNCKVSKAATDISNLTASKLFGWLANGSQEYFKMDPTELINRYSNYNDKNSMIKIDVLDDNYALYWKCINQYSNGSSYGLSVVNVVDIYPDGKVKVYYSGGQVDVTDATHLATFNSYAYILANATETSYSVESYYRYAKSQFQQYNLYSPPDNSAETMTASQAAKYNGKNAHGYSIRFLVIRMYQGRAQDRIIYGKTTDDVFEPSTGSLKIIKQDQKGNRLAGAEFSVTASNGAVFTGRSNRDGEAIIDNIPIGACAITETKAPSNYNISGTNPQYTTINAGQQNIVQVVFTNEIKKGSLKIIKKDQDGKALAGAEFLVTASTGDTFTGKSNANGEIIIDNIPVGKCTIQETKAPTDYNMSNENPKYTTIYEGKQNQVEVVFVNEIKKGSLKIIKKDQDGKPLAGAEFLVTASTGATFTGKTNANGELIINDVPIGNCTVEETKAPEDYNISGTNPQQVNITENNQSEVTFTNEVKKGEITIEKVDETTKDPMSDVGFTLKMVSGEYTQKYIGKYVSLQADGTASYSDEAVTLKTDSKGIITIKELWPGDYQLEETVMPYSAYEADYSGAVTIQPGGSHVVTAENRRIYIDLTGYVWEDKILESKQEQPNELYNEGSNDTNDEKLANVTVQLKDKNGEVVRSATTGEDGSYLFERIEIDKLKDYYIEFSYNGMCYESVSIVDLTKANSTKAIEGENRTDFNSKYAQISKGQANDQNGNKTYNLDYNVSDYKSELKYGNEGSYLYGYEGQKFPINGVDSQYQITANTKNAYQSKGKTGYLTDIYTEEEIRQNKIEIIEDINLGVKERSQPDLSIIKDLDTVKVTVNKAEHIYKYAERFLKQDVYGDGYTMEPAVKYGSKYGSMSYTRAVYASDIKYNQNDEDTRLSVKVTYKVGIRNNSDVLKAVVKQLVDCHDVKYNLLAVGREMNEDGSIKENTKITTLATETSGNGNYKKVRINTNIEIEPQSEGYIYFEFEVLPNKIAEILGDNDEYVKLDNITEISSYQTRDENNKVYAGVDVDSQPDNIVLEDIKTYEDDTDKAPGLKLVLQEKRSASGKVFLDDTTGELQSGEIRQGNGIYDNTEKGIPNVEVKLVKEDNSIAQVYDEDSRQWKDAVTHTNENGEYTISGYVPGDYKIVYTWGDQTYKVQDYKSTIVDESSYTKKGNQDGQNAEWYKDEFKKQYPNVEWNNTGNREIRRSDATDNYQTRQEIDGQTTIMTNANKEAINTYYDATIQVDDTGTQETLVTKMDSITPIFRVNVEYDSGITNGVDEYEIDGQGNVKMDGVYAVKKDGYKNKIESIDFGIVERARQVLELEKQVKSAKIILANGTVLINAEVTEDGKLQDDVKHAVYIPDSPGTNGQIKFEVENELIQGATAEIEYALRVNNISELEYVNQEYYLYGKGHGQNDNQLVSLSANNIIDYLDDDIAIDTEEIDIGEIIQDNTKKNELIQKGLLQNTSEMKELLENTDRIILVDKLFQELKPSGSNTQAELTLKTHKLLSNTDSTEEMAFDNDAEIIKIKKTGGSSLVTTPGNYIPSLTPSEYDDDGAETVSILPPTGLSVNYIAYTILAISSLGILVSGIILIKKFVLRK